MRVYSMYGLYIQHHPQNLQGYTESSVQYNAIQNTCHSMIRKWISLPKCAHSPINNVKAHLQRKERCFLAVGLPLHYEGSMFVYILELGDPFECNHIANAVRYKIQFDNPGIEHTNCGLNKFCLSTIGCPLINDKAEKKKKKN